MLTYKMFVQFINGGMDIFLLCLFVGAFIDRKKNEMGKFTLVSCIALVIFVLIFLITIFLYGAYKTFSLA
jgi:hypothetical protein